MRQGQFRCGPDVLFANRFGSAPGRVRHGGAGYHQICAHPVDVECGTQRGDPAQLRVIEPDPVDEIPRGSDPPGQFGVGAGVAGGESGRVGFVIQPGADHRAAHGDVAGRRDVHGQPEPVQQLRAQLALLGIHGADQHESRLVGVRHPVAFDVHPTHGGGVEQDIDEVVGQQVDLIDVQHAAVRPGQQSG